MKVIMYGAPICGDCVAAKQHLAKEPGIEVEYRNITESTTILKEFLNFRDNEDIFLEIKKEGKIGIPFFILEDGTKTFDIEQEVELTKEMEKPVIGCSIDGKNC